MEKILKKLEQNNLKKRLLCLIVSIIGMGLGVSILLTAGFGTDSFATVNQGFIRHLPISFGTSEALFNGTLLVLVLVIDRKQINIGTVFNMLFLGYVTDFFNWIGGMMFPVGMFDALWIRYALIIPGLLIFVFSCAGYIAAELGVSAYDAIPLYLEKKITKVPGRIIRICWDWFFIGAGWLMGATVGLVTVLMAFTLGPAISGVRIWLKKKWNY